MLGVGSTTVGRENANHCLTVLIPPQARNECGIFPTGHAPVGGEGALGHHHAVARSTAGRCGGNFPKTCTVFHLKSEKRKKIGIGGNSKIGIEGEKAKIACSIVSRKKCALGYCDMLLGQPQDLIG